MELHEYPRPRGDTGIGVHWTPGLASQVPMHDFVNRWLPEMQAMGVRWIKFLHMGALDYARVCLENDIMPIVRIFRHEPNSPNRQRGTLGPEHLQEVRAFVNVGVRYFEFNNEPELAIEWEHRHVPSNAQDIVAQHAMIDMEGILDLGGYPGVPATAIGTRWDLVGKIIAVGGGHLFDEPVWVSVHNYDINHPLDYPYDDVNQNGTPISQEEYDRFGKAAWEGKSHGPRSHAVVNNHRRVGKNPGDTIHDDPSAWLAYERFADLNRKHLGRDLPLLGTETGPIVGEDDDPRYPTTTMEIHRDKALEECRIMMGSSTRYGPAPPYYFCTAFWLMGSSILGAESVWDHHAWFDRRWPNGRLPAVDALKALPKQERPFPKGRPKPAPTPGPKPVPVDPQFKARIVALEQAIARVGGQHEEIEAELLALQRRAAVLEEKVELLS